MYYPCSENKDADQLRGYREADLRLCFRPCKLLVFSRTGSYLNQLFYESGIVSFIMGVFSLSGETLNFCLHMTLIVGKIFNQNTAFVPINLTVKLMILERVI